MKVLLIEDEPALSTSMQQYLEQQGHIVTAAYDFPEGRDKIAEFDYDCMIVDIGLPHGNGLSLIQELKSLDAEAGIIIISARNALEDKLRGLELGSDDYLTKPFHLSELNARMNALIRRKKFHGNNVVNFREIKVNTSAQVVAVNDTPLDLTGKEYQLLLYFIANQRRVVTKPALAGHVWGDDYLYAGSYDFIYTHIKNLRRKLLDAGCPDYIQTVYGTGYRFSD
ncbi:DNA-binding response regulator, OmpR family, contains REC and winged-helix (wHTH) domain [Chitinophaga costaii]|uniref:DNA-binding response regulator, OmpR family, contains REC and winged-helix (WHTH) domain n=1 Tax=Chitinophaga costaii TaxID=1335309 RepID=A0A1C4ENX4_9BACT|nr:response regulator transcription factor [Chitinophaga costaii]PUZ22479.1 DNA-binding response regulator [Chitinophaga costaii]SCC45296.1 DNA-binding response regulator, OmpR family, contains REC and winged-helix (wHTH) domain [Chitinophaga costaii]